MKVWPRLTFACRRQPMHCPRCGALMRVGEPCPACAPLASIERKIVRQRFVGNPTLRWIKVGWWGGMALGTLAGLVDTVVLILCRSTPDQEPLSTVFLAAALGALLGAILGSIVVLLYKSIVRPVLIAIFQDPAAFEK